MAMSGYKVKEDAHSKADGILDPEIPNSHTHSTSNTGPTLNLSVPLSDEVTEGVQSDPQRSAFQSRRRSGSVGGTGPSSSSSIHFAKPHEVEMLWLETVKVSKGNRLIHDLSRITRYGNVTVKSLYD